MKFASVTLNMIIHLCPHSIIDQRSFSKNSAITLDIHAFVLLTFQNRALHD